MTSTRVSLSLILLVLLAACGGGSTTANPTASNSGATSTVIQPAGTVASWVPYQITTTVAMNKSAVKTQYAAVNVLDKFTSMFMHSAIAQTFSAWFATDPYSYAVWMTAHGTDKFVLYNGGQYYGMKKIAEDGTITTYIPDTYGQGPVSIHVADDGSTYLGGTNNSTFLGVQKYDTAGNLLWTYSIAAQSGVGDQWVQGITTDKQGNVYFTYSPTFAAGTIYKLDADGNLLGSTQVGNGLITLPGYLTITKNAIYLEGVDATNSSTNGTYIAVFDTSLNQIAITSLASEALPGYGGNIGVTKMTSTSNGDVVLSVSADTLGDVIVLDGVGNPKSHGKGHLYHSDQLTVDAAGNFYTSTIDQRKDKTGALIDNTDTDYYISIDKYDASGTLSKSYDIRALQQSASPTDAVVDGKGRLSIIGRSGGMSYLGPVPSGNFYFNVDVRLINE